MPSKKVDFETARQLALALPGVEESTSYGAPSFKLRGRLLTCQAINRSAEANSLAVRIGFDLRAELLASQPEVYYVTPHYEKHPVVLVRLGKVRRKALEELLDVAWAFVGSGAGKRAKGA
jgi:hypothetical protein